MSHKLLCLVAVLLLLPSPTDAQPTFLHLSDVHLDLSGESSDTDPALWSITKAKLASVLAGPEPPSFVIYTGDLPGHYACENKTCALDSSQVPAHNGNVQTVLADMHDLVAESGIPLLYMPGNNDSLAGDYFSFTDRAGKTPLSLVEGDHYPAVNASESCGSAPCMVSDPYPGLGFYSARPIDGLRVIALNSIILGRKYHGVDGQSQFDAGNVQMDWLAKELESLEDGEKVLLAMHIPPGNDAYAVSHHKKQTWMWAHHPAGEGDQPRDHTEHWLDRFLDLVSAHTDAIIGLAYGHTHMDELRRLHNRAGEIIEVAVSAPGITTNHGNNPGFKLTSYDADTKELLGFVTEYTQRGNETWGEQSYSFSELFNCAGQSILGCLAGPTYTKTSSVSAIMDTFFTVKNGPTSYSTASGIEVEYGQ